MEGSPEHQKLIAEAQERWRKAQEAAAEQARQRQEALEAQRKKAEEDAAERQRQYQEELARLQAERERQQAEAAEKARLAAEEARKKVEAEQHARLLAVMKPFQSATGAVITAEAGPNLGTVILDAAIDEEKLTVAGRAIDLREMPFKEFTYEGSVDARGAFSLKNSAGADAVVYGASGEKLGSRAGYTIAALTEAERARADSLIELGKRLGAATASDLAVETIDAEAAKTREPELKLTGLSGSVFYRGRLAPAVGPLFAADMGANRAYAWKNKEVVSIRLEEPVKGRGLYIRGTGATGAVSSRTIGLVR